MATKEQLAIAVDFGTTYSGVAYMPVSGLQQMSYVPLAPVQVGSWPGQPSTALSFKVPTIVAYPSDGGQPLWGYTAERPPQMLIDSGLTFHRSRVFKTFIEPEYTVQYTGAPLGKTVANIVGDYLNGMYTHLLQVLAAEGFSVHVADYHVLFTVPAPFSAAGVEAFRRIVRATGFGNHSFEVEITEPEAAAIYTMRMQPAAMRRAAPAHGFQTNQCFLVCDAGGGTVDLASYSILQLEPQIKVQQTGVVHGGLCGSTAIDRAFQKFLKEQLGEHTIRSLLPAERDMMLDEFIARKESFRDSFEEMQFNIRLPRPNMVCPGSVGGYFPITRDAMRSFFENPVNETCQLVQNHIAECNQKGFQVSYVFLVGGFGTSPYLKARLEQACLQTDYRIQVLKPPEAQQSVVLGCLYTQLQRLRKEDDPVQTRLCRASVGVVSMAAFDPAIHYPHERFTHPITHELLARDQVMWLIHKGDQYSNAVSRPIERNLVRSFDRVASVWTENLVRYTGPDPPRRVGPGVEKLCEISSDLTRCPTSEFRKVKKKNGLRWWCCGTKTGSYYEARYSVRLGVGTAGIEAEMWFNERRRSELMKVKWEKLDG